MATLTEINNRVRLELGDMAAGFSQSFVADGTSAIFNLDFYPLDATSVVVKVNGTPVSAAVEERTGRLVLNATPAANATVAVTGTHYRYFSDNDLSEITAGAMTQHIGQRTDQFGRAITLENLPGREMYAASLYGSIQVLWALATDASFDIDISTPDGVNIPRSERFRQLMEMIQAKTEQYKELCQLLGIGLYGIEVFTFRRISKQTGRYIPVYEPQEVDDYSKPVRLYFPVPTYGSAPMEAATGIYDITIKQGDALDLTLDFDFDISNYTVAAQARVVPESPVLAATFTVTVVDAPAGRVTLSLTPAQTRLLPLRCQWDVQVTNNLDANDVKTMLTGFLVAERDITR